LGANETNDRGHKGRGRLLGKRKKGETGQNQEEKKIGKSQKSKKKYGNPTEGSVKPKSGKRRQQ